MRYLLTIAALILSSGSTGAQIPCRSCPDARQVQKGPCLNPEQRAALRAQEEKNISALRKSGILARHASAPPVKGTLIWPMQPQYGFNDYSYYVITQQVDLDPNIDTSAQDTARLDYNCGMRTYDTPPADSTGSGYNHDGTDIAIFPFPYFKMENNLVEAIAAADGVIIAKNDGELDRNCAWGTGRPSNNVSLMHDDGTITRYVHLKRGSVTTKDIGTFVSAGEYLGIVGSSGNSTGPHLHFEVNDSTGATIDPFFGPCSDGIVTDQSWWSNQRPYIDTYLNKLMTYTTSWTNPTCDLSDTTGVSAIFDERIVFDREDTVFIGAFQRHRDQGDSLIVYFYNPDGAVAFETSTGPASNFTSSTWNSWFYLNEGAQHGKWLAEIVFDGISFFHNFYYAECETSHDLDGTLDDIHVFSASNFIESIQLLEAPAAEVIYQAGNYIELNPGFDAEQFTQFEARIQSCSN